MIALTGATGQLGHYVLQDLLNTVPASQIVAIVRNPAKAQALSQQGVVVRQADYSDEAALTAALQGVDKLLLISSSEVGQRAVQHRNVINAAKAAGVKFIAYTSLLHADTSPLGLAAEHIETEQMLADSGIAYALLRNGWYTENYLASAPRRWSMACLSAPPARVKSPPPPARIMPPLPPALSPVRVMKAKFTNWRVITPGR
ncbi:NmrA family protein [Klebsiella pneumoniae]|nr:NmrA family protein [Klebsiella pneumoniae]